MVAVGQLIQFDSHRRLAGLSSTPLYSTIFADTEPYTVAGICEYDHAAPLPTSI